MSATVRLVSAIQRPAGFGERAFIVFVLLLSTGAFLNLVPSQGSGNRAVASSIFIQALWATLYVCVLMLLIKFCKGFFRCFLDDLWLLALLALAFISTIWSADPNLTFKRSVGLLGTYLTAIYLVTRYDLKTQLKLVSWALIPAVLLSFPFSLFQIGECGTDYGGPPGWCGIFPHKNGLGAMMALATVVFLVLARVERSQRWGMRFFAVLSLLLLVLSNSKTALVAFLGVIAIMSYSRLFRGSRLVLVVAIFLAATFSVGGTYWALHHLTEVTSLLGRSATFSGRLQLWVFCVVMALQRPWLGYGYGAFWQGKDGPSVRVMHALGRWHAFYAHNGILELWLDTGLISIIIFLVGFTLCTVRAIRLLRMQSDPDYIWPLVFLVFLFVSNLAESSLLSPENLSWLLYVTVALVLSRTLNRSFSDKGDPQFSQTGLHTLG